MLLSLAFPPGLYKNGTVYQAKGRWYDANLVRFYEGTIRPWGGWRLKTYTGTVSNPFTTVNGSKTVTVTHANHGLRAGFIGDEINFTNGATVGGLNMNLTPNYWSVASVIDANNYTFTHTNAATSSAGPAGGTVNFIYAQNCRGTAPGGPRNILQWKDNSFVTRAAIGTSANLYVLNRAGQLYDITPAGFTAGRFDAVAGGGYGYGPYGASTYGTPRNDSSQIQDATVASLDTFGQYLLFCTPDDGKIYEWQLNTAVVAALVTNSPTATALVVTDQRILMALGAAGNPRAVQWSDQGADTTWTPAATNQAGSFTVQTTGRLMLGKRFRGGVVLLTDLDVHLATYTADVFVYQFTKIGDACGAISRNCAAALNEAVLWMGTNAFWSYNGFTRKIPCEVSDAVFGNINLTQASKVTCFVNSKYSEVTWFYPSSAAIENDSYVTWNYRENHWVTGALNRLCGSDAGAMFYPLLIDSFGFVYEHEVGFVYQVNPANTITVLAPYLESGPIEMSPGPLQPADGERVMYATGLYPDEKTMGQVRATFKVRFYPNGAETSFGPYVLSAPTDVRFCGRQVRLRYDGVSGALPGGALPDWRVGVPRLDVTAGGMR